MCHGNYITSASDDGTIKIWDPKPSLCKFTLENGSCVWETSWSPDGTKLAAALINGAVMIWNIGWDTATATLASTFMKAMDFAMAIAWSPDGTRIIAGSDDLHVRLWGPATGNCTAQILLEWGRVVTVGWSPDGTLFTFGTGAKTATI